YAATMQGGAGGAVVEAGDPDSSRLFTLVAHTEEPKMPPNAPRVPDAELEKLRKWIEIGAPETSGSAVAMKAKPKVEFKLDPSSIGKPSGEPAMPSGLPTQPVVLSSRPGPIHSLAHSPWAPLTAIGGHRQVLLYQTRTGRLMGVLPFPEGNVETLRFTTDGDLLLAGGGRGGQSGRVVVWNVKTGERVFEVGKEYDTVLAADISPDRSLIAMGGPSRVLRVYNTSDGELAYECKKHTEWVTAVAFSPDGVLLASGDRNGGLVVWEAPNGREFYDLRGHQALISDLSWRLDSNLMASAAEDGTVRLWAMQTGTQAKNWNAHGGGAASVRFARDGRIVTAGRDRLVKLWDQNGTVQKQFEAFPDIALHAEFTQDDQAIVAGDFSGEVRLYEPKEGKRIGALAANPLPVAQRLELLKPRVAGLQAQADASSKAQQGAQAAAEARAADVARLQQAVEAGKKADVEAQAVANTRQAEAQAKSAAEAQANQAAVAAGDERARALARREEVLKQHKAAADGAAAASAAYEQARSDRDRMVMEQAMAVLDESTRKLATDLPLLAAAIDAANAARSNADRATADRLAAEARLPLAARQAASAKLALAMCSGELEAAEKARQAADQALAARKAEADAARSQLEALLAEINDLARELQGPPAVASAAQE
ncbi:MAG: hypothetical protein U0800_18760, partial [Isosphaeraceae bacterium]